MELLNDIRAYPTLNKDRQIYLASFLIALSGILSILDTMIPKPIPMAKIGIANMVTLVLLLEKRPQLAFLTAFLRTVVSALVVGTFLSTTFLLSLTGAVASVFFTWLFITLFDRSFSEVGFSVIGAFFNTVSQSCVIVLLFQLDRGLVFLISLFVLMSLVNGILIGLLTRYFYKKAGAGPVL